VFSSYLEYRMMDKVHKPSDPEYYTLLSEPFRFYLLHHLCPNYVTVPNFCETVHITINWFIPNNCIVLCFIMCMVWIINYNII
jgi:hypothetical protein